MMKKISYILVLFISLFIVNIAVKAFTCEAVNDMEYSFEVDADDKINKVIRKSDGEEFTYVYSSTPIEDKSLCPIKASEFNITSEYMLHTFVENNNQYQVSIKYSIIKFTDEYNKRTSPMRLNEKYIICRAQNDMEYSYIFQRSSGKAVDRVKDIDAYLRGEEGGVSRLWNEGTAIVKSESDCPIYNNEVSESKRRCKGSTPDYTWYEKVGYAVDSLIFGKVNESAVCAEGYNLNFTDYYKLRKKIDDLPKVNGCTSYESRDECTKSSTFSCVWVDKTTGKVSTSDGNGYCNADNLQYVRCGEAFDIPVQLPKLTSFAINLLKIATPLILVFVSALTLIKAITANKEDEMKKAQQTLVKRIGIAAIIFLTITITQFVIIKVADEGEPDQINSCFNCFINNKCQTVKYYKNNVDGNYQCFYVNDKNAKFDGKCH